MTFISVKGLQEKEHGKLKQKQFQSKEDSHKKDRRKAL